MSRQANSFIFPDNIIKEMKNKIKETRKKKIELGFSLCIEKDSNIVVKGSECMGTQCSIKVGKCKEEQKYIGNYHTHPRGPASLSIADMVTGCSEDIECVGAARFNNMRCFIRKTGTYRCLSETMPFKEDEEKILERSLRISSAVKNPTQILKMGIPQFLREFKQHDKEIGEYYKNRLRLLNENFDRTNIS